MKTCYPKYKKRVHTKQIRHTHRTAAGIEDATAVLLDAQTELEILALRVNRALGILRELREGPHAYEPDRPAGRRLRVR